MSKVFESLINQQLIDCLEEHELMTDVQYGFRHSWSTGDILSLITEHINSALDRRGEARLVALDISKAFDKVCHRRLIHKLKSYGISGELLNLLSGFLSEHQISVVHEGHSSSIRRINVCVPQGSELGPSLFLVFINDLPDSVSSQLAMYADDSTVYTAYPGPLSATSCAQA